MFCACGPDVEETSVAEIDDWIAPYSHIAIGVTEERSEAEAREVIFRVYRRLKQGKDFAETAKQFSDAPSKVAGGFVGFQEATGETRFSGALQALEPGTMSRPVRTKIGYQIVLRHSFAEGVRLEKKLMIPVYGLVVPWEGLPGGQGNPKPQALAEAQRILKGVRGNVLDLNEEATKFLPPSSPRRDAFMGMFSLEGTGHPLVDPLRDLPVGKVADVFETEKGYVVAKRGTYLRSVVRQILVQHIESANRALRIRRNKAEAFTLAQKALAEIKPDRSNWSSVVTRYSDHTDSVESGGWIGTVGNGDAPPNVEALLKSMNPGDISDNVIESPEGFHILWRVQ